MSTPPANNVTPLPGPVLTPEQVWDKLFALIESLRSEADLTRHNVEQTIGLRLSPRPGEWSSEFIAGDTTMGWRYIFDFLTYSDDDIRVAFQTYRTDHDELGNSPMCTYPMEALREEMKRRGFEETDTTAKADRSFYWAFSRGELGADARYYFSKEDYDFEHTCLANMEMAFTIPEYRSKDE